MKNAFFQSVAVIFITTLFLYPVTQFDTFHLDDPLHFGKHVEMHSTTWDHFFSFWAKPRNDAYTPFTYSLWFLQAHLSRSAAAKKQVYGPPTGEGAFDPSVLRTGNFLTHLLCSLVVLLILHQLLTHRWAPLMGALLFALHPLHIEPIGWITGFRDLLAALLSLLSLSFYIRFCQCREPGEKMSFSSVHFNRSVTHYALCSLFFLLAVLSKPSAYGAGLIIVVIGIGFFHKTLIQLARELGPWMATFPILSLQSAENNEVVSYAVPTTPLWTKPLIALDSVAFYLWKFFWPLNLTLDYGRTPGVFLSSRWILVTPLIVLALTLALFFYRKRINGKYLWIGFLIFVAGLFTALGLKRFIFQHISTVSDRYAYLSLLGPSLIVGWYFQRYWASVNFRVAFVGILFLLGLKSTSQCMTWESKYSVYHQMVKANSKSWLGFNNLGGQYEISRRHIRSSAYYGTAGTLAHFPAIYVNEGAALLKQFDYEGAIRAFKKSIRYGPNVARHYHNLGVVYGKIGKLKEAKQNFLTALKLEPGFKHSRDDLAKLNHLLETNSLN